MLRPGPEPRPVALFEDEWRTPLDVEVAATAVLEAARADLAGVLHVAGGERISRLDLGRLLMEHHGVSGTVRRARRADFGMARTRARDASLDASRARELLSTPLPGVSAQLRLA